MHIIILYQDINEKFFLINWSWIWRPNSSSNNSCQQIDFRFNNCAQKHFFNNYNFILHRWIEFYESWKIPMDMMFSWSSLFLWIIQILVIFRMKPHSLLKWSAGCNNTLQHQSMNPMLFLYPYDRLGYCKV